MSLYLTDLSSAYGPHGAESEPAYTTWKIRPGKEAKMCIDYIFHSRDTMRVLRVLSIPSEEHIEPTRLPGRLYPSDHFALAADIALM